MSAVRPTYRRTGQRLIVTAQLETQPAQGVMAAQYSESLTAFTATTGEKVWTNTVVLSQGTQLTCNSADTTLEGFGATLDGRWGALRVQARGKLVASAIDLSSGQVLARPDLLGALGNWLVTGTRRHIYGVADPSALAVPPSWTPLGALSNAVIPMGMPTEAVAGRFPVDDAQNPPSTRAVERRDAAVQGPGRRRPGVAGRRVRAPCHEAPLDADDGRQFVPDDSRLGRERPSSPRRRRTTAARPPSG